jgi:ABC-type nickel/cobalt efflux system permease component RcnA
MVAEEEDKPERGGALALLALMLGVALVVTCLYVAYEITYEGAGPKPSDTEAIIAATIFVALGVFSGIILIYMGGTTFVSPGLSGQEVAGYSQVRRKRRHRQ